MSGPVNKPPKGDAPPKPRGRPRSEKVRLAILGAARALLNEGGPGAVTMEAVALRAGVGKPTVYRWFPDRHAVAMAALMEDEAEAVTGAARRSPLMSLRDQLKTITKRFSSPTGRHITNMIAASDSGSEISKSFRNHFVLARRTEGKGFLQQAIESGEIRKDIDVEIALDLLYGPLFFRLLIGHAPLDEKFVEGVLEQVLRGMKSAK